MTISRSKISFYQSLYFKLSTIFLSGIIAVSLIQLWLSVSGFRSFVSEINQSLEWEVASSIANEIQPQLLEQFSPSQFVEIIYPYSIANPKLEFYLLTSDGTVFAHYVPSFETVGNTVDLEPIKQALDEHLPALPHYGQDPGSMRENKRFYKFGTLGSVFSVAPIRFNGQDGFLYIVIEGAPFSSRIRMIGQFFISRLFSWGWLATILTTGALAYLLYRALTRRFRAITKVVQEYETGNYTNSLNVTSADEIGVLSSALNAMAQKLIFAKSEIELRDKKRRELIALITHDLRSPLAATQGYIDLAKQNAEKKEYSSLSRDLDLAANSSRFQGYLVESLFELSKLEAKEQEPNIDIVALDKLCQKVVDRVDLSAASNGVRCILEISGTLAFVLADEALLQRVMNNLVENAVRFSPENGVVKVILEYGDLSVRIAVSDSGQGIGKGQQEKITELFHQADVLPNESHSGAGLGLAIVRRILELHSTQLVIESSPGVGSSFSFSLPLDAT